MRDPARLPSTENLDVIQGDVTNADDVKKAISGQDGVVVAIGTGVDLCMWLLLRLYVTDLDCICIFKLALGPQQPAGMVVCPSGTG